MYITNNIRRYYYYFHACIIKGREELFVCYTLGKMVDILIQGALMIADTSVDINSNLVKINLTHQLTST